MKRRYLALGILLTGLTPLVAQQVPAADNRSYVMATGEARVPVKPDRAMIDVGVVTQSSTAVAAGAQNAKQTEAVLAELRKMVTGSDALKTTGYSVNPNYQTPKPGGTPTIAGYTASNTVQVTLDDLTQVGKVIDAVLQSGANTLQRLQFGLKNPQVAHAQALREAGARARANAEAIAAGLGVRVVRVLSAEENGGGGNPVPMQRFATMAAATQVEAGTVEVTATITLKVEIAP